MSNLIGTCFIFKLLVFTMLVLTSLAVPEARSAEVELTWERPDDPRVEGYYIYWGQADYDFEYAQSEGLHETIENPDNTSFTMENLYEDRQYQVAAQSYADIDGDGNAETSPLSQIVTFTASEDGATQESSDGGGSSGSGGCFISSLKR